MFIHHETGQACQGQMAPARLLGRWINGSKSIGEVERSTAGRCLRNLLFFLVSIKCTFAGGSKNGQILISICFVWFFPPCTPFFSCLQGKEFACPNELIQRGFFPKQNMQKPDPSCPPVLRRSKISPLSILIPIHLFVNLCSQPLI